MLADSVAAAGRARFLLVTADLREEILIASAIRRVAPDRVEIWTVPGAGHGGCLAADPAAWTSRVTGFLSEALRGGS